MAVGILGEIAKVIAEACLTIDRQKGTWDKASGTGKGGDKKPLKTNKNRQPQRKPS